MDTNNKPALLGGTPTLTTPLPPIHNIGEEEVALVSKVLREGPLSGFIGAWGEKFFGGPMVRQLEDDLQKWAACDVLGIHTISRWRQSQQPNRKAACIVRISKIDNLVRVSRMVPIQSARKRQALAALLSAYTRKTVLPMAEELADMYAAGSSVNEISKRYGVGIHAIMHRLKSHGVSLRCRGEASRLGRERQGGVAA